MVKEKNEVRILNFSEEWGIEAIFGKRIQNTFQRHIHSTYLFGLVEAGTRSITCGDDTYCIAEKELFVLQPSQVHACTCSADHCYSILSVTPEMVEEIVPQHLGSKHSRPFFPEICHKNEHLSQQLRNIFALIKTQGMNHHALTLIQQYIAALLQYQPTTTPKDIQLPEPVVDSACQFLKKNHAQKLPLSSLAEHARLSPFHFQRIFLNAWE